MNLLTSTARKMAMLLLATCLTAACDSESASENAAPVRMSDKPSQQVGGSKYPPRPPLPTFESEGFIGANPPPVGDNSRTHVFVDLMQQARRFGTPETPWDEKALLNEDGWPIGDFGVFLMTRQEGVSGIPGVYKVSFTGQAKVSAVASKARVGQVLYDPLRKRSQVDVTLPADANQLVLAFTQTGAGIRDLKIIRPGYDVSTPPRFTQPFLAHIKRFSTLRFMDWLRTNNNPVRTWDTRSTPGKTHYASSTGVPWEYIIELANLTQKDIWINVPAGADDGYVNALALLIKDTLNEKSRIYVEYSNEVWNGQFKQHGFNFDLAEAEVRENPRSPLAHDGKTDRATLGYRRIAKRGKEISDIFRHVFGDDAMLTRVRPIYAIQVVNTYATEIGLTFLEAVYGPPNRYFYALAGAPYFNLGPRQTDPNLTTDDVLDAMTVSIERLPEINRLEKNMSLAKWYGLPFVAYEGGSDTFGPGSLEAKKGANLDPRMEGVCRRYLNTWFEQGGGLFMWFNAGAGDWSTPYGAWELTTDLAIDDTPKTRCIDRTRNAPPSETRGRNSVPGAFPALNFAGNFAPFSEGSRSTVRHLGAGKHLDYLIDVKHAGQYSLSLNIAAQDSGNLVELWLDGHPVQQNIAVEAGSWEKPLEQSVTTLTLERGLHTLRLISRQTSTGFDLKQISIQPAQTSN